MRCRNRSKRSEPRSPNANSCTGTSGVAATGVAGDKGSEKETGRGVGESPPETVESLIERLASAVAVTVGCDPILGSRPRRLCQCGIHRVERADETQRVSV